MSVSKQGFLFTVSAVVLLAASQIAPAQVAVHMTTAQGNCVAQSGTGNLQLRQGSADMEISGSQTTLTGSGCGLPEAGNFAGQVTAPAAGTVGTPLSVIWYVAAPTADTRCYYNADRTSTIRSDWPTGALACSGMACPTSTNKKTETINFNQGGTTPLKYGVVCTNLTGLAQSAGTTVAVPPDPAPTFTGGLTISPTSGPVNSAFVVKWNVANATACTGTASLNGSTTTLAGWTGAVPVNGSTGRTVTPATAGTYALTLTCTNGGSAPASTSGSLTVTEAPVDACINPEKRLTSGNITYWYNGSVANVDLREWTNIWGRHKSTDPILSWPGSTISIPTITWVDQNKYIAAHFTVGSGVSHTASGILQHFTNNPGPNLDATISKTCGDFDNGVGPYCRLVNKPAGANMAFWKRPGVSGNYCELPPGEYFLNVRMNDPSIAANHFDCNSAGAGVYSCKVTIQSTYSE